MKVTQHLPSYIEGERNHAEVSSLEQLLALGWVNLWADLKEYNKFKRFSRYHYGYHEGADLTMLMAELQDSWRVVAIVEGADMERIMSSLPEWREDGN